MLREQVECHSGRRVGKEWSSSVVVDDPEGPPHPPLPDVPIRREVLVILRRPVVPLTDPEPLHDPSNARGPRPRVAPSHPAVRRPPLQLPLRDVDALVVGADESRLLGVPIPFGRARGHRSGRAVVEHAKRRVSGRVRRALS